MKKFFEEFREFALKGNVMDMAIGVIIGGAFQNIVKALIDDIINPLIGLLSADRSAVSGGLQQRRHPDGQQRRESGHRRIYLRGHQLYPDGACPVPDGEGHEPPARPDAQEGSGEACRAGKAHTGGAADTDFGRAAEEGCKIRSDPQALFQGRRSGWAGAETPA